MDKISIIIPIYNVEAYLRECIDSVLSQNYPNLEIILIDDGSTDSSSMICDDYMQKYKTIQVIHKQNGGLSDARNVGLQYATGAYIFFLDSDDFLAENSISELYKLCVQYDADIAVANFWYFFSNSKKISAQACSQNTLLTKIEAMRLLLENRMIKNFAWGKLYKSSILNNLAFPVGKLFEDVYWTHLVFDRASHVIVSPNESIYYRQRDNSISYTFSPKKIHLIEGYLHRRAFVEKYYPQFLDLVDENIMHSILGLYNDSIRNFHFAVHKSLVSNLRKISRKYYNRLIVKTEEQIRLKHKLYFFVFLPAFYFTILVIKYIKKKVL